MYLGLKKDPLTLTCLQRQPVTIKRRPGQHKTPTNTIVQQRYFVSYSPGAGFMKRKVVVERLTL